MAGSSLIRRVKAGAVMHFYCGDDIVAVIPGWLDRRLARVLERRLSSADCVMTPDGVPAVVGVSAREYERFLRELIAALSSFLDVRTWRGPSSLMCVKAEAGGWFFEVVPVHASGGGVAPLFDGFGGYRKRFSIILSARDAQSAAKAVVEIVAEAVSAQH